MKEEGFLSQNILGIDEVGIYRLSRSTKDILHLRKGFDCYGDLDLTQDYCDPNAVASLFKANHPFLISPHLNRGRRNHSLR